MRSKNSKIICSIAALLLIASLGLNMFANAQTVSAEECIPFSKTVSPQTKSQALAALRDKNACQSRAELKSMAKIVPELFATWMEEVAEWSKTPMDPSADAFIDGMYETMFGAPSTQKAPAPPTSASPASSEQDMVWIREMSKLRDVGIPLHPEIAGNREKITVQQILAMTDPQFEVLRKRYEDWVGTIPAGFPPFPKDKHGFLARVLGALGIQYGGDQ